MSGRPRPAWRVTQRPARVVNRSRGGPITGSCSVTVPAAHSEFGQRQRRLCHTNRVARPNAGRSTNSTVRSPLDHNGPPQASQPGRGARRRTCTPNGSPTSSTTPHTSTSPKPTNNSHMRVESTSTGILQFLGCLSARFWRISRVQPRTLTAPTPPSNAKSRITAVNAVGSSDETQTDGTDRPTGAVPAPSSVTAVPSSMMNTDGGRLDVTWSGVTNAVGYLVEHITTTANPAVDASWIAVALGADAAKEIAGDNYFDAGKARKVTITTGLSEGTTYVVRVRAITQVLTGGVPSGAFQGTPGFSAPVEAEGTPGTEPGSVVVAQPEKTTTLRVTWTPPTDAQAEGVTGYVVTWYPTSSTVTGNRGSASVGADARSYDITRLTAIGQAFTVVVAAVNDIGAGEPATGAATLMPATT